MTGRRQCKESMTREAAELRVVGAIGEVSAAKWDACACPPGTNGGAQESHQQCHL